MGPKMTKLWHAGHKLIFPGFTPLLIPYLTISYCNSYIQYTHFLGSGICRNGMNFHCHLFGTNLDLFGFDFLPI